MLKIWQITSFLLLINISVLGQNKAFIDSLNQELNKQMPDTSRILVLLEFSRYYQRFDGKKSFEYLNKARVIAKNIGAVKEMAHIYYYEGKTNSIMGNDSQVLENYQKALDIYISLNIKHMAGRMLLEIGTYYMKTSDYPKALENFSKSLELFRKAGHKTGMACCYGSMSDLYNLQKDYNTSIEYLQKAIGLTSSKQDKAFMFNSISENYRLLGNYNKALLYFDSIVPIFKEIDDFVGLYNTYLSFGNIYFNLKNYNKASEYFKISEYYANQLKNQDYILYARANLSELYVKINQPDSAIFLLKKVVDSNKPINDIALKQIVLKTIFEAYEKKGDLKSALEYYKKYKSISDSSTKQLCDQNLLDIQTKWEVDKKNEQIKLLNKNNQIAKHQFIIYSTGFITIIILVLLIILYRHRKNREKRLILEVELKKSANKINLKNRELTHKAIILTQQEQILLGIKEKLLNVEAENNSAKEAVLSVLSNIDIQLRQNTMDDFEKYFIEVHPTFYVNLKQKHPELAPAELKVCALLRLNLNSKEIASITNKTIRSVETIRTNIRKKMGLSKENLYEVMSEI
jgi:tetratricopeptide (TPR) repeat protein/DNA-binding CsgD family transcriptional regulator